MPKPSFTPTRFAYDTGNFRVAVPAGVAAVGFKAGDLANPGYSDQLWYEAGEYLTWLSSEVFPASGVLDIWTIRGVGVANGQPRDLYVFDNGGGGILVEGTGATAAMEFVSTGGAQNVGMSIAPATGTMTLGGLHVIAGSTVAGGDVALRVSGGAATSTLTLDRDTGNVTLAGGAAVDITSVGQTTIESTGAAVVITGNTSALLESSGTTIVDSATATNITSDTAVNGEAPSVTLQSQSAGGDVTLQVLGGTDTGSVVLDRDAGSVTVSGALMRVTATDTEIIGTGTVAITPDGVVTIQSVADAITIDADTALTVTSGAAQTFTAGGGQISAVAGTGAPNGVFATTHRLVVATNSTATLSSMQFAGEIVDAWVVGTSAGAGAPTLNTTSGLVHTFVAVTGAGQLERATFLNATNRLFAIGDSLSVTSPAGGAALVAYITTLRTA